MGPHTATANVDAGTVVDAGSFRELLAFIRPKSEELRWQAIPWQQDIFEACRLAAEQGKPVFLWTMNGNPLGCT